MSPAKESHTRAVKTAAKNAGFSFCGISKAGFLEDEARHLEEWLNKGLHGKMLYMENHFDKRVDPRKLVDGAKSVITLLFNYYNPQPRKENAPKISQYAYGEDYHVVVKDHLKDMVNELYKTVGNFNGRFFVDSAPVLDKAWAVKSGAGWMGKNTNVINRQMGSFFFIAEIICDLELQPDGPIKDYCGSCTACIDACPTQAITQPYVVDGSKCISYFTIELKDSLIPGEMKGKFDNWMFGCDVCQDVCPWNSFSKKHNEPRFEPRNEVIEMKSSDWKELTEEIFAELFKNSPLQRPGFKGVKRNIDFLF
jgi:epoxyqueuosine reductase